MLPIRQQMHALEDAHSLLRALLATCLYRLGGADPTPKISGRKNLLRFPSRIVSIAGNTVTLERPLPCAVMLKWQPQLRPYESSVSDVGVEHLTLRFAPSIYNTHHHEKGYTGIQFAGVANCWVRNVAIVNFDNGIVSHGECMRRALLVGQQPSGMKRMPHACVPPQREQLCR